MQWLNRIEEFPDKYARFLNTLSMLEYMGARKIIKSQAKMQLDSELLDHIQEEIRHACVLKRAALKIQPTCTDYSEANLLCGQQAGTYFQAVDHAAPTILGDSNPWHCYLYTTYLVETRAVAFYTQLQAVLLAAKQPNVFRGILVEEEKHLSQIITWLQAVSSNYADNMEKLQQTEQQEFALFMKAVEQEFL